VERTSVRTDKGQLCI